MVCVSVLFLWVFVLDFWVFFFVSVGLKILFLVLGFEDVFIFEKFKFRFIERVLFVLKVRREFKNLSDIWGFFIEVMEFIEGNFVILVLGGGYLYWGYFEMMCLIINCFMDFKNMFVIW